MAHVRQQIREAFAARITGLTTSGNRVYQTRVYPSDEIHLPGHTVYTLSDRKAEESRTIGHREGWDLTIVCESRAKPATGEGDVDDVIDTLCAEVQKAVMTENTLGQLVLWMELMETQMQFSGDLERPVGIARMLWLARYYIDARDPEVALYLGEEP